MPLLRASASPPLQTRLSLAARNPERGSATPSCCRPEHYNIILKFGNHLLATVFCFNKVKMHLFIVRTIRFPIFIFTLFPLPGPPRPVGRGYLSILPQNLHDLRHLQLESHLTWWIPPSRGGSGEVKEVRQAARGGSDRAVFDHPGQARGSSCCWTGPTVAGGGRWLGSPVNYHT